MTHIIAIAHHAGGVGKTTTALNLGYALASSEQRVLLVDLDPQADLTLRLNDSERSGQLAAALTRRLTLDPDIYTWEGTRLDLIPSDLESMAGIELALSNVQRREDRLIRALTPLLPRYEWIILDCPPALNVLTLNALYTADSVLIPIQAQDKAVRQLKPLLDTLYEIDRDGLPFVLGELVTMTDNTRQSREAEAVVRRRYGGEVFTTTIPRRTIAADDSRYQAPVAVYAPDSPVAAAYTLLAQEVVTRAQTP